MNFKDFLNEKVNYMSLNQLKKQLKKDYGSKASSLKIVKVKGGVSIQTPGGQELERYNNVPKLGYTVVEEKNPRIPRKKGQPANSKKHSDLYTDENPKGTIKGLGFKDVETAEKSVKKIEGSGKSHAHKIQAAIAMEQRARVMGKKAEAAVYRKFINKMKEITKSKNESLEESRGDLMKSAEYLKLINQAMSAMPGSPKQKGIIKKINAIRVKAGFKPLDEADGCWDGFKKVGMKKKGNRLVPNCVPEEIEEEMKCPPATQDLSINTKNRDATIKKYNYGPLNVDEPGNYWEKIAKYWKTTTAAAKKSLCANCVAFDISPRMKDCMPGKTSDKDGVLGYCWMHHFKCHSARACHTWAKGGPIKDNKTSEEWQEKSGITEGKGKPESWESGFERRVVKTTKPEHKEKGYEWRIKGKDRPEVTIKLYRSKPSFAEFKKQMKRVAGWEFGG